MSRFLSSAVAALGDRLGLRGRASRRGWIRAENKRPGSRGWRIGAEGTKAADDIRMQIKGYASATSVNLDEAIDFHVTVTPEQDFTVAIYRLGYYGGDDARHLTTSPTLGGVTQPEPDLDPETGMISCGWPSAWSLKIPRNWISGLHLAVFTTTTGWRSFTPFVVRNDARSGGLCVLLPFSTYQAYNQWPLDGQRGKSLYYGYARPEEVPTAAVGSAGARQEFLERAYKVSFDRPYFRDGLPNRFDYDRDFLRWVEQSGYDVTYADSLDLHSGLIDPERYVGLIFCGHDEYWSHEMREAVTKALVQGTSLAFMTANNLYWHVRVEPSADGRDNRVVVCYKKAADPAPDASGTTAQWRVPPPGPGDAEQRLLGVQYNGIVPSPVPLVVQAADHWFWAGCDVKTSDKIDRVVGGEADGLDPRFPAPTDVTQTLLSASPYQLKDGTRLVQNTSLYETQDGAIVFVAGSLDWPPALSRNGLEEPRIRRATTNLLDRMTGPRLRPTGQKESTESDAMSQTHEQPTDPQKPSSKPVSLPSQERSVYEVLYTKGGFGYDANVDTWRTWVEKHYVAEFDLKPGMRLLDVGCGDGFWAMLLAEQGMEVAGIDRAASAIEVAQSRLPEAEFVRADITNPLPFEPESFDVAFMRGLSVFGVPEIVDDATDRQLANIARVVRPGGMLLASTYTNLSGVPSEGSTWINHRVSTIVAAIEKVAEPFKVIRAENYLQVGARRRDDI